MKKWDIRWYQLMYGVWIKCKITVIDIDGAWLNSMRGHTDYRGFKITPHVEDE